MKREVFINKNCFITGATGGIGRCIAMKMAENKCNLFLTSTNVTKLKNLKEEIESRYGETNKVYYEHGDLNEIQDIKKIIRMVRKKIHTIDILVNCAGLFVVKFLSVSNLDDFDTTFNLNIRAPFIFCKEFSEDMVKTRWGRIVNIGSSSAYAGSKETSLYCASKHALLGFSRALHDELKKYNIRTYCVSPSGAKTEMGKLIKNQNFDTFIDPTEIAEYVTFICSFDGEMISDEVRLNRMVIE
ncbi:MAG: SDR family oxidoreductase [Bacteroidales bacterium]|nr:SDR family oxidoreductase [Bacteroidales bacterium]